MPGKETKSKGRRWAHGFRAIGPDVKRLTRPLFGARGFANADIIAEWPLIVGEAMGAASIPEKVQFPKGKRTGATLHLRVRPGGAATEIQHAAPVLIDRVNTYFGYGAVSHIKLVQAPLPERPAPIAPPPDAEPPTDGENGDSLERALDSLGRHVRRRDPSA